MKLAVVRSKPSTKPSKAALNQWCFSSDLQAISYGDAQTKPKKLQVLPVSELVKAERRIARGSLRPFVPNHIPSQAAVAFGQVDDSESIEVTGSQ